MKFTRKVALRQLKEEYFHVASLRDSLGLSPHDHFMNRALADIVEAERLVSARSRPGTNQFWANYYVGLSNLQNARPRGDN